MDKASGFYPVYVSSILARGANMPYGMLNRVANCNLHFYLSQKAKMQPVKMLLFLGSSVGRAADC